MATGARGAMHGIALATRQACEGWVAAFARTLKFGQISWWACAGSDVSVLLGTVIAVLAILPSVQHTRR